MARIRGPGHRRQHCDILPLAPDRFAISAGRKAGRTGAGDSARLGVKPLLGRSISPEDDVHGAGNAVAVLGYGYWHDKLGGETSVLNQPIHINGQVFTVVGVAPKGLTGTTLGDEPAAYVPLCFKPRLTMLARYTESQLYGVKAYDAMVVAAGYLPARRASKVNPLDALRYE